MCKIMEEIASDEQISLATGFTVEEIQTLAALVKTTV